MKYTQRFFFINTTSKLNIFAFKDGSRKSVQNVNAEQSEEFRVKKAKTDRMEDGHDESSGDSKDLNLESRPKDTSSEGGHKDMSLESSAKDIHLEGSVKDTNCAYDSQDNKTSNGEMLMDVKNGQVTLASFGFFQFSRCLDILLLGPSRFCLI